MLTIQRSILCRGVEDQEKLPVEVLCMKVVSEGVEEDALVEEEAMLGDTQVVIAQQAVALEEQAIITQEQMPLYRTQNLLLPHKFTQVTIQDFKRLIVDICDFQINHFSKINL